eukprot:6578794-Prymnesium_polylepis.1
MVAEPIAAAIGVGEMAPTAQPTLTAATLTAAARQMHGACDEDLRRCCDKAPRKGEQTRWSEHKSQIEAC